jgi:hypothetical protein
MVHTIHPLLIASPFNLFVKMFISKSVYYQTHAANTTSFGNTSIGNQG